MRDVQEVAIVTEEAAAEMELIKNLVQADHVQDEDQLVPELVVVHCPLKDLDHQ